MRVDNTHTLTGRSFSEKEHAKYLLENDPIMQWGWGTPAGKLRALRRAELIMQAAHLRRGMKVLEIGCGTGMFTEIFAASGAHIVAVDISPELLTKARERHLPVESVEFVEARFEDCAALGPFDAVIGSSVLHHLEFPLALERIFILLKAGGTMSFAEPNYLNPQVWFCLRYRQYFPQFSPDETAFVRWPLCRMLKSVGFENVNIVPFDFLHPAVPQWGIKIVRFLEGFIEKMPLMREIAGSLHIVAHKP